MNFFQLTKLSISLTLCSLLIACAGQSSEPFVTQHNHYQISNQLKLEPRQRADLFEAIIAADLAEHNKDYLSAMSYYLFAAELSQNQQLIDKSIEMAQITQDPLGLEQAVKLWLILSPNNLSARTLLFEAQIGQQNMSAALKTVIFLLKNSPGDLAQYQLLQAKLLNQEPRVTHYLLQELLNLEQFKKTTTQLALITAQAKFYFNMAVRNQQTPKLFIKVLRRVEDALAIDPLFGPAVRIKTNILFQTHKDRQARHYLQKLLQQAPQAIEINQIYGQLLYDIHDYPNSLSHHNQWLKQHPDDLAALNYLAASHYALAHYVPALALFKQLLKKNYQTDTTAFYCGDSAQKSADTLQAIDCFKQVKKGRFVALAKIQLAKLLTRQSHYQQALRVLTTQDGLSEKAQIQLTIAEIDLLKKHFSLQKAKQRLTLALNKTPDELVLILKKIELYQLIKQPVELNLLLLKAQQQLPPGAKLDRFNLAVAALLKNNHHYQLAINWLSEAIKHKPGDKELRYTHALYLEPLGLYQQMIKEFKQLLAIYPDDLNIKNALGYTLADLGKELEYAQALIDSAYQGLPNSVAVIDSKGWLAYRLGQYEAAEEYLRRAFKLSPSAEGAAHLGEVLWQRARQEQAKWFLQQGLKLDKNNKMLLETLERLKIEL